MMMANGGHWNEWKYRAGSLGESVQASRDRGLYLSDWLRSLEPFGASVTEIPREALTPLVEYELTVAQEKDRLAEQSNERASSSPGSVPAQVVGPLLESLQERVAFLESAIQRLEDVTDWIESFSKTQSGGKGVVRYVSRAAEALDSFNDLARAAMQAVLGAQSEIADQERREDELAREGAQARIREQEASAARVRAEAAQEFADHNRTKEELSRILKGRWSVEVYDPLGNLRDAQTVLIKQPIFGPKKYLASSAAGWRADASWTALDGVHLQVSGLQGGASPGLPVMALAEVLTFSVIDEDHLECETSQSLRLRWARS